MYFGHLTKRDKSLFTGIREIPNCFGRFSNKLAGSGLGPFFASTFFATGACVVAGFFG
jgi:hypothetical protein